MKRKWRRKSDTYNMCSEWNDYSHVELFERSTQYTRWRKEGAPKILYLPYVKGKTGMSLL